MEREEKSGGVEINLYSKKGVRRYHRECGDGRRIVQFRPDLETIGRYTSPRRSRLVCFCMAINIRLMITKSSLVSNRIAGGRWNTEAASRAPHILVAGISGERTDVSGVMEFELLLLSKIPLKEDTARLYKYRK